MEYSPDTEMEEVIEEIFPQKIRENNGKFFALVFGGWQFEGQEEEREIVAVMSGSTLAEIDREDYQECASLQPWERVSWEIFKPLVVIYRKAVCLQG
jgi:hypothetical protein